ncbi:MAG: hypothetical protein GSR80_001706 [Desulfurococcales archaeon]|nr:hypothetical protein [Desulfurococcales archaeon]
MERELISQRYVPYSLARSLMYKRVVDGELGMLQERVWDYLREFGEGDAELAAKAFSKLLERGIPEHVAAVILSICPRSRGELLSIFQMDKEFKPGDELFDEVLSDIEEFCRTTPYYE